MLGIALFLIVAGYVVIYAGVKSLSGDRCSLADALTTCCGIRQTPVNERSNRRGVIGAGVPRTVPIVAPVPVGQPVPQERGVQVPQPYYVSQGALRQTRTRTTNALNNLSDWLRNQLAKARGLIPRSFPLPPPPLPGF